MHLDKGGRKLFSDLWLIELNSNKSFFLQNDSKDFTVVAKWIKTSTVYVCPFVLESILGWNWVQTFNGNFYISIKPLFSKF